jgi:protein-L-isoaspartate(D-aspartate) O-methyltransferase
MKNFAGLRGDMIERQLLCRGISDKRVLSAMNDVARHIFVPEEIQDAAYDDRALPIGYGQTISQPYMVAIMSESLKLGGSEKVLEIGTGSGYQAAILSHLAKEVYTIERIPELAERAKKTFGEHGYGNISVIVGDGTLGLLEKAPFDAILVTAAAPSIPQTLLQQLSPNGGRLVIPIGDIFTQILTVITKTKNEIKTDESIACVFVPLIGKFGWKSSE